MTPIEQRTQMGGSSYLFIGFLIVWINACQSHEQKADDAFEQVKEKKETYSESEESVLKEKPSNPFKKSEAEDQWCKFKMETEKKINMNEEMVKAIKSNRDSDTKLFKKVSSISNENSDLSNQLQAYEEEEKLRLKSFKTKIETELNQIKNTLNDWSKKDKK